MVIRKIPKKQEAFISGSTPTKKPQTDVQSVLIRIPRDMIDKIEDALETRPVKVSRNVWLLEAINAYLK